MKVQLLYLDPHDDQVSVRDKMGWVKAPRLLVVWPRRGRVLCTRLDLILIKRQALHQGAQLGLVTFDPDVRDQAQELGIPVFDSVDSTPETIWRAAQSGLAPVELRTPDRARLENRPHLPAVGGIRPSVWARLGSWLAFALGLLALAGLAIALGPSATITVSPTTHLQRAEILLTLDPAADIPMAADHVPAERRSVTVTGSLRLPSTGQVRVPAQAAQGTVLFTNLGQEAISVPRGSGVQADPPDGPRFVTLAPVTLDARSGAQATAPVQAAQAGSQGNVPAGAIGAIEGPLGLQVSVTNPEPTQGGAETAKPAVAPADVRQLEERLRTQLLEEASTTMAGQLAEGEAWTPSSLQVDGTPEMTFDRQVNDVALSVSLAMKLEASGLVYRTQAVHDAAQQLMASQMPPGSAAVPATLSVQVKTVEGAPDRLAVTATQSTYQELPRGQLIRSVAGQLPEAATALVESRYPVQGASLDLRPGWLPRLPWLATRISLRYPWQGG